MATRSRAGLIALILATGLGAQQAMAARFVREVSLDGGAAWFFDNTGAVTTIGDSATVLPQETFTVSIKVETTGSGSNDNWVSTAWDIGDSPNTANHCQNTPDHNSAGTFTETFSIQAPATLGTIDAAFRAAQESGCSTNLSPIALLADAITVAITPNPTLGQGCGLDVVLLLDVSTSISGDANDTGSGEPDELTQVHNAAKAFVNALLPATPSRIALVKFSDTATEIQALSSDAAVLNAAIDALDGSGSTNWEGALTLGKSILEGPGDRNDSQHPDLIVNVTDGDPTTSALGTDTNQPNIHLTPAVIVANSAKVSTSPIRIVSVGVGTAPTIPRLIAISGPTVHPPNSIDQNTDVILADFADLAGALGDLAVGLCGGSISVSKVMDPDGDPNTTEGRTTSGPSVAGWTFTPDVTGGSSTPLNDTTVDDGMLNFEISIDNGSATVKVAEQSKSGYEMIDGSCTGSSTNNGSFNSATQSIDGIVVNPQDIISCTFINALDSDCNMNGTPDDQEPDCNMDGTPDTCEADCNQDGTPDECETDCNQDGTPDECEADSDQDGTPDECDECPGQPGGDTDDDGVCDDDCPNTPTGEMVDENGCSCSQLDDDHDGVNNCDDDCPNTPTGESVDDDGCSCSQLDGDNDGVNNCDDDCLNTPSGDADGNGTADNLEVDEAGCHCAELDSDNDGVNDCDDDCPGTSTGEVDENGCACSQLDDDNDTVNNCDDECEGFDDLADNDNDNVADGCDLCPGYDDNDDNDNDGTADGCEDCDNDGTPDESEEDCDQDGTPDDCEPDSDGDGVPDDCDDCAGGDDTIDVNGNGTPDACDDCDHDGTPDASEDDCNSDGTPDDCESDMDGDGVPDECDICYFGNDLEDCDTDGTPDDCESDCDEDGTPDDCDADNDSDDDGVSDCDDVCRETAPGDSVEEHGCSCEQALMMMEYEQGEVRGYKYDEFPDTDGDGIIDICDACPNTPEDELADIDENGCTCADFDDEKPVILNCPEGIDISLDANCDFVPPELEAMIEVSDNCTAVEDLVITTVPADLNNLLQGLNHVTIKVTDSMGNTATCKFDVKIFTGDCPQAGGGEPDPVPEPEPEPQTPPCTTADGGLNLLMSALFHAPVCGVACPIAIAAFFCGMVMMKKTVRPRRNRRDGRL